MFALFYTFLKIGLLSIGGGYAIIPLIQMEVVEKMEWLTIQEYSDIITISQMTPGPLAVNTATFVGLRVLGIPGAIVATVSCVISGCLISMIFYQWYLKNKENKFFHYVITALKSASLGLIISAAVLMILLALFGTMSLKDQNSAFSLTALCITIISLFLLRKYRINPIMLLILSGFAGIIFYYPW